MIEDALLTLLTLLVAGLIFSLPNVAPVAAVFSGRRGMRCGFDEAASRFFSLDV